MLKKTVVLVAVLFFVDAISIVNAHADKNTQTSFHCADNDLKCVEHYLASLKPVEFKKVERDNSGRVIEETVVQIKNATDNTQHYSLNQYQASIVIKKLTAIKNKPKNSILKTWITEYPSIRKDLTRLRGTEAMCVFSGTGTMNSEVKNIIHNGLSTTDDAGCKGSLIDELFSERVMQDAYHDYILHHQSPSPLIRKPAIYLYPKKDSKIEVSLDINGRITKTIPEYKGGWDVNVTTEGIINGNYDYLFYEATLNSITVPKEGWVVQYNKLSPFFDKVLKELNFNAKEAAQFKDYWLKKLKPSPYYEVKLLSRKFVDKNLRLDIHPKPDSIIRAIFYFKPFNESKTIKAPNIKSMKREGFVVVEWGGLVSNNMK